MFEAFVKQNSPSKARLPRRLTFIASVALHGGLLLAAVAHSFWHVDELTPPGVTVTFINALTPPPPPPPPPAATAKAEKAQPKVKRPRPEPVEIVQPAPTPEEKPLPEEKPEAPVEETTVAESEGPAAPQGEAGGVEGGIAGGVLGRIAPAPPPRPAAPVSIAPHVGAAHRLTDLEDPRYRPRLPASINRPGMTVWGVFRICVAADGHVLDVTVVKSADALVDNDWIAKIKTWQYRPYSVDGRPVPFCHPARIFVKAAN